MFCDLYSMSDFVKSRKEAESLFVSTSVVIGREYITAL